MGILLVLKLPNIMVFLLSKFDKMNNSLPKESNERTRLKYSMSTGDKM